MELSPKTQTEFRPKGEAWVWLSATGLVVGIAMIVGLLGFIGIRGLEVFWPKRIELFELRKDAAHAARFSGKVAGAVQSTRQNRARGEREYHIFIGNKEAYGNGFIWLNANEIASVSAPKTLMRAERKEYGDAVFEPLRFSDAAGTVVSADSAGFDAALNRAIRQSAQDGEKIARLQKEEIGALNVRMERIARTLRSLREKGGAAEKISALDAELSRLRERHESLSEEVRLLRAQLSQAVLTYRLPSGTERSEPISNILQCYRPNALSFWQRLARCAHNVTAFLLDAPREANTEGGVFPALFGTLVMTVLMSAAVMPLGVLAAVYLREYAKQGTAVRLVRICINNLAGVPSIVFGVVGLGFLVYIVGGSIDRWFFSDALPTPTFGTGGILWASLTLALMTLPVVIVATEEALAAVPAGVREASLACGASKWQTVRNVVLPASAPGILTGLILAMARGAGEVAPLMLVGVVKMAPSLPLDGAAPFLHLERKFMHLGFHIYDLGFQSPDAEAAEPMVFATTLLLVAIVVTLNLGAIHIRNRLRRKYAGAAF